MTQWPDFADEWLQAWNSHDLDRILSHYSDDIRFRSRKAIPLTGDGLIRGKRALRAYWQRALDNQPDLHFRIDRVYRGHEMLVIAYRNQKDVQAAETLCFGPDGTVIEASACHMDG